MLDRVRPPGSPPFGERHGACRIARLAEPPERAPDPEIRRQERIGVAQSPHGDVGGSPGSDPLERHELPFDLFAVGTGIEDDLTGGERESQVAEGAAAGHRHGDGHQICVRDGAWLREEMGKAAILGERLGEWLPVAGSYPAGEGPGAGHGYLLAEHRSQGELGTVDAPGDAPSRRAANEGAKKLIGAEDVGDGYRIRVEIQESAASLHRGPEVSQILQPQGAPDVVIA